MSTAIDSVKSFEEKMVERIRKDLGDLMPEEVLKGMVEKTLEKAFTEERITRDSYGRVHSCKPAIVVEFLQEELKGQVSTLVQRYVEQHGEDIMKLLEEMLCEGFAAAAVNGINSVLSTPLVMFQEDVKRRLENLGQYSGVPDDYYKD